MTDYDKLNAIITKARLLRQSTTVTPNEVWLSDLIEALALAVREHDRQHQMTLIEPGGYPAEFYGTPYRSPTEESA